MMEFTKEQTVMNCTMLGCATTCNKVTCGQSLQYVV